MTEVCLLACLQGGDPPLILGVYADAEQARDRAQREEGRPDAEWITDENLVEEWTVRSTAGFIPRRYQVIGFTVGADYAWYDEDGNEMTGCYLTAEDQGSHGVH